MVKPEGKQQLARRKKRRDNNVKDLNERLLAFFSLEDGSDRVETAQSQLTEVGISAKYLKLMHPRCVCSNKLRIM